MNTLLVVYNIQRDIIIILKYLPPLNSSDSDIIRIFANVYKFFGRFLNLTVNFMPKINIMIKR